MINKEALSTALSALDSLMGLSGPKKKIKEIVAMKQLLEKRAEAGLPTFAFPYKNMVFTGNHGTGKSLFARHLGEIYKALGILSHGHIVECDRSQLVGGYVGRTTVKTQKLIDEAMGGILFIDSAENLYRGNSNDFGREALDTIYRAISDPGCDLVVIFEGYEKTIEDFLNANVAIATKVSTHIHFDDLTADILYGVFMKCIERFKYTITEDARHAVREHFDFVVANKDKWFGNARIATMYFENVASEYVMRVAESAKSTGFDAMPIELCDVTRAK